MISKKINIVDTYFGNFPAALALSKILNKESDKCAAKITKDFNNYCKHLNVLIHSNLDEKYKRKFAALILDEFIAKLYRSIYSDKIKSFLKNVVLAQFNIKFENEKNNFKSNMIVGPFIL
jgi:hypothetical protein